MKTRSFKKIICLLATIMLLSFSLFIVNYSVAKAEETATPPAVIDISGASMRFEEPPTGLRFEATMKKADVVEMRSKDPNFETGILFCPAELLNDSPLTLESINAEKPEEGAMKIVTTDYGFLSADDTTVTYKAYIHTVPFDNYETEVVGVAYYTYNGVDNYSKEATTSLLKVAEAAYESNEVTEDIKSTLYSDHLKPYYLQATDFIITELENSTTPSVVNDYDSANKALTVTLPKFGNNGTTGQNEVRTRTDYAPGTYIMMEFLGANIPNQILFGETDDESTGDHVVSGVGFWLDAWSGSVQGCYKGKATNADATAVVAGNLRRGVLTQGASATTKYVLIVGAEKNADDNTKTDLTYYLYTEANGMVTLFETRTISAVGFTLVDGRIELRTTKNGTHDTVVKLYQPDTYANLTAKLGELYRLDDVAEKFDKTANTTMSTNPDGSYTFNMPFSTTYNYVATKQTYAPGTYFMAEFKGNQLPGMVIFGVDNANDTLSLNNATGATNITNKQNTWNGVGLYTENASNVLSYGKKSGSDAVYTLVGGKFTTWADSSRGVNYDQDFVLVCGAYNDGENAKLHYILYTKNGTELTLFDEMTYTITGMNVNTGSILFASVHRTGAIAATNMTLNTIGTKSEVDAKLDSIYILPGEEVVPETPADT